MVGPSGGGKSTLADLIPRFYDPGAGRILLDGQDLGDTPPYARPINMMFQSYALFPHLSVLDNVAFSERMKGTARPAREARAMELLKLVHMEPYAQRLPAALSGGQQQRVALARALMLKPQVLLLDEPLSALDPFLRVKMRAELKRWHRELGMSFVHVTQGAGATIFDKVTLGASLNRLTAAIAAACSGDSWRMAISPRPKIARSLAGSL